MKKPMKNPTYLYHALHGKTLVEADKAEELLADGWMDSHAKIGDDPSIHPAPEGDVPQNEGEAINGDDTEGEQPDGEEGADEQEGGGNPLADRFVEDPESLEKPELLALGKSLGLNLLAAWKEETLRNKIGEAINGDD